MAEQPDLAQAVLMQSSSVHISKLFVFVPGQPSGAKQGACSPRAAHVR